METEFLTSKDAASYLDISTDQLYKLNSGGKIPSYRPTGGKVYYLKTELIEWVLSGRRATIREVNSKVNNSLKRRM
jgi:excisionase family DNA binding protein